MQRSALHIQNQIKKTQISQNNSQINPQDQASLSKKSNSAKFIPFVNERDSIGRLIKKPSLNSNLKAAQNYQNRAPFLSIKRSVSLQPFTHTQGIQSSLNVFFKQNCVYKKTSPEKLKLKVIKKPSLQQFMVRPPIKIQVRLEDSLAQVKQLNQQLDNIQFGKSQSLELRRFDEISVVKKQIPLQKKYSLAFNMKPSSSSSARKLSKVSITTKMPKFPENKVKVYNLQRLKHLKGIDLQLKNVKGKVNECQQLQRYRQMKKLGMNLFEDIDEGHNLFLKKIKDSKQLAYKIKQGLES